MDKKYIQKSSFFVSLVFSHLLKQSEIARKASALFSNPCGKYLKIK